MVTIRLQRRGRRKRPIHHIVVADSRSPRDGRIVEDLGRFNNLTPKNEVTLDEERAIYWLKQGAQPSDTVRSIFKNQGILYRMHLIRWGKSEEEIEEALTEWREKRAEKEEKAPSKKERQRAMLEAEEKEYQKQLKKKAEEAAKEKAKQQALAEEEDEEVATGADEDVEAKEEEAEVETEEQEVRSKKEEEPAEESAKVKETETEEEQIAEAAEEEAEEEAEVAAEEEKEEAVETEETEAKEKESAESEEEKEEQPAIQVSTDMLAKEAIEYIKNTPLDDLKGFVPDGEDRVTVQRAWKAKKED